eukprot:CCRYP_007876-RA/>CCRYP_007876-RA protein AED:0.43 eAED:0.43 QI:12/1/1/1/0/0/2/214/80
MFFPYVVTSTCLGKKQQQQQQHYRKIQPPIPRLCKKKIRLQCIINKRIRPCISPKMLSFLLTSREDPSPSLSLSVTLRPW